MTPSRPGTGGRRTRVTSGGYAATPARATPWSAVAAAATTRARTSGIAAAVQPARACGVTPVSQSDAR